MKSHWCSADTAIFCITVPIDDFLAFACYEIEMPWDFIERCTQAAHFVTRKVDDWCVDAERLHAGRGVVVVEMEWYVDFMDCCPFLYINGWLFTIGDVIMTVGCELKKKLSFAEYEPVMFQSVYNI